MVVVSPASIFLSYARGDDEPYARNLFEGLRSEGYDVWFNQPEASPAAH